MKSRQFLSAALKLCPSRRIDSWPFSVAAPYTVLISDDEDAVARALIRQLRRHGIGVFHDGDSDVVAMAASLKPHLILLDYMQRVNGGELLEALKANAATAPVPVIVITAVDEDARRAQCQRLGALAFVSKPFPDTFVPDIVRWLAKSAASPAVPWEGS